MLIKVERKTLDWALRIVSMASSQRASAPVGFRSLRVDLDWKKKIMSLSCFNQTLFCRVDRIPFEVKGQPKEVPNVWALSVWELQPLLAASLRRWVFMEQTDKNTLVVKTEAVVKFPLYAPEDVEITIPLATKMQKGTKIFGADFFACAEIAARDMLRPVLTSVCLTADERLLATDGHSVALVSSTGVCGPALLSYELGPFFPYLLAGKDALEFAFSGKDADIHYVQFRSGPITVWSVVPDGQYPVKTIVDTVARASKAEKTLCVLDRKMLEGMILRAKAIANDDFQPLDIRKSSTAKTLEFGLPDRKGPNRRFVESLPVLSGEPLDRLVVTIGGLTKALGLCEKSKSKVVIAAPKDSRYPVLVYADKDKRRVFWLSRYRDDR